MKLGQYNIFVGFLYLTMLYLLTSLFFISLKFIHKEFEWILLIPIFLTFICLTFWIYFFRKFRIILISEKNIISIQPFLFKVIRISRNDVKKFKWSHWYLKSDLFLVLEIISNDDKKILISDAQFANLHNLASVLINKNDEKFKSVFLKQVEENNGTNKFTIFVLCVLLVFQISNLLLKNNVVKTDYLFIIFNLLLIFASINRLLLYKRIIKQNK